MKLSKRGKILLASIAAPLLFVVAFALVIVLYNNFHTSPSVTVSASGFAPQTIEITEGESIRFVNQSSTSQTLCLGTDQRCDRFAVDPPALKGPGLQLAPGQSKVVVFQFDGTFNITSTTKSGLNLTVTVDAAL